jgi:hypothetical protein
MTWRYMRTWRCVVIRRAQFFIPGAHNSNSNSNSNSIKFFIIYVLSQQLQGQLQTPHSVDTVNYIMDTHNIKPYINYRKLLEENTLMETLNKQTNKDEG